MTPKAVITHRQTHPLDGRAWWGLAKGQTKRDMEASNRGKVHSLNDHRQALKVGGESGGRRVRDHRMRTRVLTFTMWRWYGPCWLSTRSRPPDSDLYLTRLTVPLCYMSTMLHYKRVPFALRVNDNDRYGNNLHCRLSAVLAHDVDDQMGLCWQCLTSYSSSVNTVSVRLTTPKGLQMSVRPTSPVQPTSPVRKPEMVLNCITDPPS